MKVLFALSVMELIAGIWGAVTAESDEPEGLGFYLGLFMTGIVQLIVGGLLLFFGLA